MEKVSVLQYLTRLVGGEKIDNVVTHQKFPTAISQTLKMNISHVNLGEAKIEINADAEIHGNQLGTVHGGLLAELADATIGTAHSTLMKEGESFTSLELKINFFRPVWKDRLVAYAKPIQQGKTIAVYNCEITNTEGKVVASVVSTILNLRGEKAKGR